MQISRYKLKFSLVFTISLTLFYSCERVESDINLSSPVSKQFSEHWHQGKAEINRYQLDQVRYGEVHKGDAVLLYVTEDFLVDKQVKNENSNQKKNSVPILKLNFTRDFNTGIYPYSLMTSVFHPVSEMNDKPLKITSSSQEWCGHTYMQLNNKENKSLVSLNSYFENEADQLFEIDQTLLEDDIWLLIRLNPDRLPEGRIKMVPGMQYVRLLHQTFTEQDVMAEKKQISRPELSKESLVEYRVEYKDLARSLSIIYTQEFPYEIIYWEEEISPLRIKERGKSTMLTRATRTHTQLLDYWNKNALADSTYRHSLGIK